MLVIILELVCARIAVGSEVAPPATDRVLLREVEHGGGTNGSRVHRNVGGAPLLVRHFYSRAVYTIGALEIHCVNFVLLSYCIAEGCWVTFGKESIELIRRHSRLT